MTNEPDKASLPGSRPTRAHGLGKALLGIPLLAATGWLGRKAAKVPHDLSLPPAVSGERRSLATPDGTLAYYVAGPSSGSAHPPLLLIHSINAAGSAYEVRPLYERLMASRTVYALELPGFGFSERRKRLYTPRLMTDAVLGMTQEIRSRHGAGPIDALALSLSSEFLARAASEQAEAFRTLAFVSPTGFDARGPRNGPPGSNRGMPALYSAFTKGPWRRPLFDLLTSRVSIRYFLEKTWGSKAIDEGLLDYDYRTTHQPGADHAPFSFISGFLFSNDITRVYDSLTQPIWMVHGSRGDFTDYRGVGRVKDRPNWSVQAFETGALPHFERPDGVVAGYDGFLAAHAG